MPASSTTDTTTAHPHPLSEFCVVGLDPGRRYPAFGAFRLKAEEEAIAHDEEGSSKIKPHVVKYSGREAKHNRRTARAQKRRRRWATEAGIQQALTELPTPKTHSAIAMRSHIAALFLIVVRVRNLYRQRRVLSLRFTQYVLGQRVMNDMCERIVTAPAKAGDTRPVMVAFGAAKFSSSTPGHPPAPVRGLRRALRDRGVVVHDIDEYNTSKLCHLCHLELSDMRGQGGGETIYAVRRCETVDCPCTILGRDANAAMNMRAILLHMRRNPDVEDGGRPPAFTRPHAPPPTTT